MQSASQNPQSSSIVSWGIALAATSLLTIGGGSLIWNHRQAPSSDVAFTPTSQPPEPRTMTRSLPAVPPCEQTAGLHTISYGVENGTPIVRIRVVPEGDEIIVDANTGRVLETRPSRPTAPPPMGKFAAPFSPVM